MYDVSNKYAKICNVKYCVFGILDVWNKFTDHSTIFICTL